MNISYYQNTGKKGDSGTVISTSNLATKEQDPSLYYAPKDLINVVNAAIFLNKPILLTGEPGTGKTQFAHSLSFELFGEPPLVFNTKSNSEAKDLFYTYDSLTHFRDANLKSTEVSTMSYISFQALGLAIKNGISKNKKSVVLIDEIDKAPREFVNDLLHEIESYSFSVREAKNVRYECKPENMPIIVITSNSEKALPDPFLRRVLYFNIDFPDNTQLQRIIEKRFGPSLSYDSESINKLLRHFEKIRDRVTRKKPATSELISWIQFLDSNKFLADNIDFIGNATSEDPELREILLFSYSILLKDQEDLHLISSDL
ncbi:MAG: MoxR family ATPase [bacterium]|nr:MoxR family ATPase [bacterium]